MQHVMAVACWSPKVWLKLHLSHLFGQIVSKLPFLKARTSLGVHIGDCTRRGFLDYHRIGMHEWGMAIHGGNMHKDVSSIATVTVSPQIVHYLNLSF